MALMIDFKGPSDEGQTSQKPHPALTCGRRCLCPCQVFGVYGSAEQSGENEAHTASGFSPDLDESREQRSQTSGGEVKVNSTGLEYELILWTVVEN